jgi:tetratricopeptide (TPR) repeat protein
LIAVVAGAAAVWQSARIETDARDAGPIMTSGLAMRAVVPDGADERTRMLSAAVLEGIAHGLRRDLGIRIPTHDTLSRLSALSDDALVSATRTGGVLTATVTPVAGEGGSRLELSLKLASAAPGWPTVFSGLFQSSEDEIAVLAARATREIGRSVGQDVADQPIQISPPKAYSLGRFFAGKLTEADLQTAVAHYNQAIEERPEFAPAYAARSEAIVLLYGNHGSYTAVEALSLALEDARRAVDLNPTLSGGHTALAWAAYYVGWDWSTAENAFRLAIVADPRDAVAHHLYADFLSAMGRPIEALAQEREALELDPASLRFNRGIGWIYFFAGDFQEAAKALEYTLTLDPGYEHARTLLARTYSQMGMHERALSEIDRVLSVTNSAGNREIRAHVLAQAGRRAEAVRLLNVLAAQGGAYTRPYFSALVWSALGENAKALDELERAFVGHDSTLVNLCVDPRFQHLHSQPRFDTLCRRLKLAN